ncbi:hypothetical protein FVEN_g785 [Fusarium venenatum]|uniref:Uncharacterized protein n=1 Tax=Fusarium venenatum TaxID=56646 RepID=A0A2L2TID0_9HYPO|nr:uncharacterized protein FVRRES_10809 [Fusarium venenatum]KAG8361747.1 hypothetical protein FVEN_g785 [Fusarium venenatum]KAH6967387.1 hypothetical protein EDB82DRAFT_481667 [Fusarium venenatum]CEI70732.1 unnamed protein product [Fusarium venenatum]
MNKLSLALALATTANAAWIPIGHGPSSNDNTVPTGTVAIAIPTIADPDAIRPTGSVPIAIPTIIVSEDLTVTYQKPDNSLLTPTEDVTMTYQKPDNSLITVTEDITRTYQTPDNSLLTPTEDVTKTFERPVPPIYTLSTKTYEKPAPPIYTLSTKTYEAPIRTVTSVIHVPGPCNTNSCHPSYTTKTVVAPVPSSTSGCSPVRPSLCPPVLLPHPIPSHVHRPPVPAPTGHEKPSFPNTTYPDPRPIDGKFWSIKNMTRYCGEDEKGCDYNFAIEADGKTENCTIVRHPGSDAATESWTNVPCNDKSEFTVSWGYVTEPAPAFAVVTVVKGKILAWFGVADINGQKVTASNPFGSGHYGNLGPDQVYTY